MLLVLVAPAAFFTLALWAICNVYVVVASAPATRSTVAHPTNAAIISVGRRWEWIQENFMRFSFRLLFF
jgi:hypothetical protein